MGAIDNFLAEDVENGDPNHHTLHNQERDQINWITQQQAPGGPLSPDGLSASKALGSTFSDPVYDDDGNLTSWTQDGLAVEATYEDGNLATLTVGAVTREFSYDDLGQLEEIS